MARADFLIPIDAPIRPDAVVPMLEHIGVNMLERIPNILSYPGLNNAITAANDNEIVRIISNIAQEYGVNQMEIFNELRPTIAQYTRQHQGFNIGDIGAYLNRYNPLDRFARPFIQFANLHPEGNAKNALKAAGYGLAGLGAFGVGKTVVNAMGAAVNYSKSAIDSLIDNFMTGSRQLYDLTQPVELIKATSRPTSGVEPVSIAATKATTNVISEAQFDPQIRDLLQGVESLILKSSIIPNDELRVKELLMVLGKAQNINMVKRLQLEEQLQDNILSMLKRRLNSEIDNRIPVSEFSTASMRQRALQPTFGRPVLVGNYTRI